MSAESANQSANQSANKSKKRSFSTISNRKPKVFTFSNNNIKASKDNLLLRGKNNKHKFNAVSNETIKKHYGQTNTPKGGKRSGQKTRRHRSLRRR